MGSAACRLRGGPLFRVIHPPTPFQRLAGGGRPGCSAASRLFSQRPVSAYTRPPWISPGGRRSADPLERLEDAHQQRDAAQVAVQLPGHVRLKGKEREEAGKEVSFTHLCQACRA